MRIIFVRHGPKEVGDETPDAEAPLAATAPAMAQRLSAALEERQLVPRYILSSRYRHALETAELLRGKRTRKVIPVTALTPCSAEKDFSMATIVADAWAAEVVLFEHCDVLMLVGHESRLSQLAGRLLQQPALERLAPLEALVVELNAGERARFKE
jgi:phosphohistidine phosphatase SixA